MQIDGHKRFIHIPIPIRPQVLGDFTCFRARCAEVTFLVSDDFDNLHLPHTGPRKPLRLVLVFSLDNGVVGRCELQAEPQLEL